MLLRMQTTLESFLLLKLVRDSQEEKEEEEEEREEEEEEEKKSVHTHRRWSDPKIAQGAALLRKCLLNEAHEASYSYSLHTHSTT